MSKLWLIFCFLFLTCSAQNWKNIKNLRTADLKQRQNNGRNPQITPQYVQKYGVSKSNENHFRNVLQKILKVRVPGTQGSQEVRQDIENEMSSLGWTVEEDTFRQNTVVGPVTFTNIIATLDPAAPRRMVIACHYDSKLTPRGFLAATDSAVPCAQMINLAYSMQQELQGSKGQPLTLQFIFFDGEEAFKSWTSTDSLYGSRHLAAKWQRTPYSHAGINGSELDRIDVFMLLDLLGASRPVITSSYSNTDPWFRRLVEAENVVTANGLVSSRSAQSHRIFRTRSNFFFGAASIEDDHKPFEKRGVPILHLISSPFPDVWHTLNDNINAVDAATVEKLNMIFRIFVAEYLSLQ